MAITNNYTACSIQEFADWATLNPLLFNTLDPTGCNISTTGSCEKFWEQYDMPDNHLSREQLALQIAIAEAKVRTVLGTFACPTWVTEEEHAVPTHYDKQQGLGRHIEGMTFRTNNMMVSQYGRRESTLVATPTLTYVDSDGDGFNEGATLSATLPTGVAKCDLSRYKLYFVGNSGNQEYEVRPARLSSYDSASGAATWYVDSWLLIDPSLYLTRRFAPQKALDACNAANYVTDLEVRLESGDTCLPQAEVLTKPQGCVTNCVLTSTPACVVPVDDCLGTFQVRLQGVDDVGCVASTPACLPTCEVPVSIRVSYQAGCHTCDVFDDCWLLREAVYKLAASALPIVFCDCGCFEPIVKKYQEETSLKAKNGSTWNFPSQSRRLSPWGTTLGALEAFIAVESYASQMCE